MTAASAEVPICNWYQLVEERSADRGIVADVLCLLYFECVRRPGRMIDRRSPVLSNRLPGNISTANTSRHIGREIKMWNENGTVAYFRRLNQTEISRKANGLCLQANC